MMLHQEMRLGLQVHKFRSFQHPKVLPGTKVLRMSPPGSHEDHLRIY